MPTTAADKNTAPPGELFVNNAGLVICHPLLPALFERLSLMQEQRWVNEAAQYRAVMLTAFLASGEDQPPEFVLALNKILCGLETSTVLPAMEELTAAEKTACDEMLEGLIAHWTALKNTGPAALRQTFLQRSGKLTATGSGRRLQVEQKTVDVLLNTLPWGIGVIRLPWMKELLFTEWN